MAEKFRSHNTLKLSLTDHACKRMSGRSISAGQIDQVLRYGRVSHTRNATIYAVGRREVKEYGRFLEPCDGIHVLCGSDGEVITTYRNHELKGLRR
ncbi:DUF4258 domain-containing protein [Pelobacter propionicus]|uniref:DUF4258 domain-containing protein n=1 Tax=Pelobacter propionicus (strain DSM 2379 / NBRC 103807 / OttBd1) TaxID=338966 RepID=A1AKD3_PELPD|nr:DUF4258 domain-containing protein [Pelobacter propionicus]ABK97803.1 hypothetical protein Ppro_0167 [Pelobacter propionicus DSM 2379]